MWKHFRDTELQSKSHLNLWAINCCFYSYPLPSLTVDSPVPKTPPPGKQVDGRENVEQVKETGKTVTEDTAETLPAPTATGTTPETPQHPDAELCDEAASPSGSPEETTAQ